MKGEVVQCCLCILYVCNVYFILLAALIQVPSLTPVRTSLGVYDCVWCDFDAHSGTAASSGSVCLSIYGVCIHGN